mmetsp:Transcript_28369/g.72999  ORF Transcript_28369/g.72999 Transcript_28369/m.72999 type:complete len:138 (+) Transcript_28369:271-684(+)
MTVMTPDDEYGHMLLGMTRSLGDFHHQRYGVTWEPEVVCEDLAAVMGDAERAVLCVASDGVWDVRTFDDSMVQLLGAWKATPSGAHAPTSLNGAKGAEGETGRGVAAFFEESRRLGRQEYADGADNLTGVVLFLNRV